MINERRLPAAVFDRLIPLLGRLDEKNLEAARLVLVHGFTLQDAAALTTTDVKRPKSRQAVHNAVNSVWKAHQASQAWLDAEASDAKAIPEDWLSVRLIVPTSLLRSFAAQIEEFVENEKAGKRAQARNAKALNERRISAAKRDARRVVASV